jgi:thiamine-monophosphate kinase
VGLSPQHHRGLALAGGDDYELLAAIPPRRVAAARRMLGGQGIALTEIGVLTAPRGGMRWIGAGRPDRPWPEAGWDPFRSLDGRRTGAVGTGASEGPTRR